MRRAQSKLLLLIQKIHIYFVRHLAHNKKAIRNTYAIFHLNYELYFADAMSTHNLLFYMDQQHWDMCSLSDKKKFDWPLLFKNQLMLKAQKTVPKGIPATHAV